MSEVFENHPPVGELSPPVVYLHTMMSLVSLVVRKNSIVFWCSRRLIVRRRCSLVWMSR